MEFILPKKTIERLEVVELDIPAEVVANRVATPEQTNAQITQAAMSFGMGMGMGIFIGSTVSALHFVSSGAGLKGRGKTILGAGIAFGSIFGFGSLVRG